MICEFTSAFADRLNKFIEQKNAVGFPYAESVRFLRHFDTMCAEKFPHETSLSRELCLAWAVRRSKEGNNAFRNRLMPIREFGRYLNRNGETAFILPTGFVKKSPRFMPHIYTKAEIITIWSILDAIEPLKRYPIRHLVIPTIMRLIYCCGLRPCEARRLRVSDVDIVHGRLFIAESKGHKDRIVLMADDVAHFCSDYDEKVSHLMPGRILFFPDSTGQLYTKEWLNKTFRIIRAKAGISGNEDHPPRVYDFRHSFATHRLYQWMYEGKDVTAMLPYLSAYMGHAQISDTCYYIHLVPGLLQTMSGIDYTAFEQLLPEVETNE